VSIILLLPTDRVANTPYLPGVRAKSLQSGAHSSNNIFIDGLCDAYRSSILADPYIARSLMLPILDLMFAAYE